MKFHLHCDHHFLDTKFPNQSWIEILTQIFSSLSVVPGYHSSNRDLYLSWQNVHVTWTDLATLSFIFPSSVQQLTSLSAICKFNRLYVAITNGQNSSIIRRSHYTGVINWKITSVEQVGDRFKDSSTELQLKFDRSWIFLLCKPYWSFGQLSKNQSINKTYLIKVCSTCRLGPHAKHDLASEKCQLTQLNSISFLLMLSLLAI